MINGMPHRPFDFSQKDQIDVHTKFHPKFDHNSSSSPEAWSQGQHWSRSFSGSQNGALFRECWPLREGMRFR